MSEDDQIGAMAVPKPGLKRELSITTPTWDQRVDAAEKTVEAFPKEQEAVIGHGDGMLMEDDSADDDDYKEDKPKAKKTKGILKNSTSDTAVAPAPKAMPLEEKQETSDSSASDPYNGCYEPVSQRTLGTGAYGVVSKGKCVKIVGKSRAKVGEIYALKKIRNVFRNRTDAKRILRELRILRSMRHHDCIVRVVDIIVPKDLGRFRDLYVVFELIDTDMSRVFASDQHFKMLHVKYFMYQILRALKYMHSANLVHRDLKPANVLVNEDCSLRVADFGLSRCLSAIPESLRGHFHSRAQPKLKRQLTEHMQTRWYRAPEVCLLEQRRDTQFAMDIWGAGCILGELLQMVIENCSDYTTRRPLFRGSWSQKHSPRAGKMDINTSQIARIIEVLGTPADGDQWFCSDRSKEQIQKIAAATPREWVKKFPGTPPEGIDMLTKMLMFDPRKRLTVDQCLSHPFLAEVRQPSDELRHQKITFEFEDMDLKSDIIRGLIVKEIEFYHPEIEGAHKAEYILNF